MPFTGKATTGAGPALPPGVEDISDLVGIVSPFDTPLLDALGDPYVEARSTHHEWLEDISPDDKAEEFDRRVRHSNPTQIFSKNIEVDFQKTMALRELLRELENAVINGIGQDMTQGRLGKMDGLIVRIRTNHFALPTPQLLDETNLNQALRVTREKSQGQIDMIVSNGFQKRVIAAFSGEPKQYPVYESDFGVQKVVLSRWVPRDAVLLLDSSRIEIMPLTGRSFQYHPLAATGDFQKGQVLGEYTMEFRNEAAHGIITGLAVE
jgi:hypothetical protein